MAFITSGREATPPKATSVANLFEQIGSTPGGGYAVAGLALSICANEVWRYPIAMDLVTSSSPLYNLLIALTLFAASLLFARRDFSVVRRPGFVGTVAAVATVCLYGYVMSGVALIAELSRLFFSIAGIVLFVCWISELYKKAPVTAAALLIAALGLVFCFQAVVGLLSQAVIKGTCALFPCFSALLYLLYKSAEARSIAMGLDVAEHTSERVVFGDLATFARGNVGYVLLGVIVLCHGILFAQLHTIWLPAQEGWGAFAIQLASAAGSLVACAALSLVSPLPNRRMSLLVCESLLLVFSFFAMWLSTAPVGSLGVLYLTMLNAAQKTLIYLLFFACLSLRSHNLKTAAFCALYGVFRLGTPVTRGVDALLGGGEMAVIATSALMLLSLAVATALLVLVMANPRLLPSLALENRGDETARTDDRDGSPAQQQGLAGGETEQYKKIAFYFLFGQKYNLTQREIELLPLLTQRHNAKSIADELSISQATAKTHIRNIYVKLDVHTQDDLVDVVERDRASLFEQLPSWYLKD